MIKHKRRHQFAKITDEAIKTFVRHEQLAKIYTACIDDDKCHSAKPDTEHCPGCREYIATNNKLDELLGSEPWMSNPVVAVTAEPPDWMVNQDMRTGWLESWALRSELERLARARGLL
jgi:hypothetical protein